MSATGGTLSDSSATIDDNGSGSGELTHTEPRAASGGDINFDGITWSTTTSESGSFTINACGQPVSQGLDGSANDGPHDCDTMTVTVRPVISGWTGTTTYNENAQNGAYLVVDGAIGLNSSANLNRVETNITNALAGDALGCPSPAVAGISCSGTGTTSLLMTGAASRASYDTAIQGIRFRNTSENPSTSNRTVRVRVRDSSDVYSNYVSKTIDVNPENDVPTITGVDGELSYNEADPATVVEATITLADAESANFLRAEVDISTACQLTEDRLEPNLTVCGTEGLTCDQTTNCAVTITGDQPIANYKAVLETITYLNISNTPNTAPRTVRYRVQDTNSAYSTYDTKTISVVSISFPPVVADVDNVLGYTENDAASLIDNAISLSDPDSSNFNSAEVRISAGCQLAEDRLEANATVCDAQSLTCAQTNACEVDISGNQPIANYQAVLQAMTYRNVSDNPDTSPRTVRYQVFDEGNTPSAFDTTTINITADNDPPVLSAIANQTGTEGSPINVTGIDVGAVLTDPDTVNNGTDITWTIDAPNPLVGNMDIDNFGVFTWTPALGTPPPPAAFGVVYPIIISADDGEFSNSVSFDLTIDPPDTDADGIAEYNDYCPGATPSATSTDPTNADFDGDGTYGSDADPNDSVGGDVCDIDDDNDGMPDSFEEANGFEPFDAADASEDADGDGISNLQEFLDGTSPTEANVVIDATGFLTPYELNLVAPEPASIHSDATEATPFFVKRPTDLSSPTGPYRPGDNTITWRLSNATEADLVTNVPGNVVAETPEKPFFVRPLVSFSVDQQAEENTVVTVTVRLNGDSPSWTATPIAAATVNYTVSGTASNPDDHDAVAGVLSFAPDDYEEDIVFNVLADAVADPDETIVLTLTSANNAVIGSSNSHTVTVVEGNLAPRARLRFEQGGSAVGSTFEGSAINVDAMPSDTNATQTLSCDWSGTDNALLPPGIVADCIASSDWDINVPVAGNYLVDVVVTDNGVPARSTRVSRILHVAAGAAPVLGNPDPNRDRDRDGTTDVAEGYGDSDGDGIPDYLDDARIPGGNLIPDQTADLTQTLLLETEPGLTLRRGSTTQAANLFGALVTDSDIEQFGSVRGDAPVNAADSFEHVGGIYDFQIDGMIPGSSARIVIPLQSAIPRDARHRKFNPATGWGDFVVDAFNQVASASGELGACPEPGSSAYVSGLNYLHNCLQLTIQDGGPNDTDNLVNGVINDPATVGLEITEPEGFEEVEEGSGGRISPMLLAALLMLTGFATWRRRRGIRID